MVFVRASILAIAGLCACLVPASARAQPRLLLSLDVGAAVPVTAPASERFHPGGTVAVAGHVALTPYLAPSLRLRGALLGDGPPPNEPNLRDPGVGSLFTATVGLRFRPQGIDPSDPHDAAGFWIEVEAGGALTGTLVRPAFGAGLGFAFDIDDIRLGPAAHFVHVLHFDDPLDASSAHLVTLGAEMVLFDGRRAVEVEDEGEEETPSTVPAADEIVERDPCAAPDGLAGEGCPDADDDGDGLANATDGCPDEPEDPDGFEDADGCPDPDNDDDMIADTDDACPDRPETLNGVTDSDGCPDQGVIEMVEDRVVIEETVLFDFNRARVKSSARPVLAAIVELWRQHPEWGGLRVEGHADQRGDAEWNQTLSERRAARVRDALIELGMPADAIETIGHGASRPRDARRTEAAYERNRRVEFVVIAREGAR